MGENDELGNACWIVLEDIQSASFFGVVVYLLCGPAIRSKLFFPSFVVGVLDHSARGWRGYMYC